MSVDFRDPNAPFKPPVLPDLGAIADQSPATLESSPSPTHSPRFERTQDDVRAQEAAKRLLSPDRSPPFVLYTKKGLGSKRLIEHSRPFLPPRYSWKIFQKPSSLFEKAVPLEPMEAPDKRSLPLFSASLGIRAGMEKMAPKGPIFPQPKEDGTGNACALMLAIQAGCEITLERLEKYYHTRIRDPEDIVAFLREAFDLQTSLHNETDSDMSLSVMERVLANSDHSIIVNPLALFIGQYSQWVIVDEITRDYVIIRDPLTQSLYQIPREQFAPHFADFARYISIPRT